MTDLLTIKSHCFKYIWRKAAEIKRPIFDNDHNEPQHWRFPVKMQGIFYNVKESPFTQKIALN